MGSPRMDIDEPYDAVIFTHYHGDHTGMADRVPPDVPMYIGRAAKEFLLLSKRHQNSFPVPVIEKMRTYRNGESFTVGDIRITPVLTDHSAFDAYMLLMEAEGRRILHTGDFRTHGIRGNSVLPALAPLRGTADLLICEGTNLSCTMPVTVSEYDLGYAAEVLMERFAYTFVLADPLDIDRLAVFHRASAKRGPFFCDPYQMMLLDEADRSGREISPDYSFCRRQLYREGADTGRGFCMAVRTEKAFQKILKPYREKEKERSLFICAVPEAYLKKHEGAVMELTEGFRYVVKLHTSGHASAEALYALAQLLQPGHIIPIHTAAPENLRLGSLQNRILHLEDGDSYDIL